MAETNPRDITFAHSSPGWRAEGVQPPDAFKQRGFEAGYKPPADYFNWFWTRVSDNLAELQTALADYAGANEADKQGLGDRVDASCRLHSETTQSATARGVQIAGVDGWDDLLNRPIQIRASAAGSAAATTLALNNGTPKALLFPLPGSDTPASIPPERWVATGGIYTVLWDGANLLCSAQAPPAASTGHAGVVRLDNSLTSTSLTDAATANAVRLLAELVAGAEASTLKRAYPVGSYYMSANNVNPATVLGFGTWASAFIGKSPLGVDPGDTDFNAAGKTGGAKTVALTTATIPSHTHAVPAMSVTSGATGASHNHAITNQLTTTDGAHTHASSTGSDFTLGGTVGGYTANITAGGGLFRMGTITSAGAHNHYLSGNTDWSSGSHTHSVNIPAGTYSTGGTGSGSAHGNMHPYETVYFWKRTA